MIQKSRKDEKHFKELQNDRVEMKVEREQVKGEGNIWEEEIGSENRDLLQRIKS